MKNIIEVNGLQIIVEGENLDLNVYDLSKYDFKETSIRGINGGYIKKYIFTSKVEEINKCDEIDIDLPKGFLYINDSFYDKDNELEIKELIKEYISDKYDDLLADGILGNNNFEDCFFEYLEDDTDE